MQYIPLYINVLKALVKEFYNGENITSIYFGGGTPSLLPIEFIDKILTFISSNFKLTSDIEITIEANPKTIDRNKAIGYKSVGINRLSIGVQSLIDADLRILGRIHNAYDAIMCVHDMSGIFSNISIDLIYNRPGQTLENWEEELKSALNLPIKHISLYELIVEDNTYIKYLIDNGFLAQPSKSEEFFNKTIEITNSSGFKQYEVSNFAVDSKYYGRHNLSYWNYEDYYGVGAGAHSRVHNEFKQKCAIPQYKSINTWCEWAKKPTFKVEVLSDDEMYTEQLLVGLRTKFGINCSNFNKNTLLKHAFERKVWYLEQNDYILKEGNRLILTHAGLLRLNAVLRYLISEC